MLQTIGQKVPAMSESDIESKANHFRTLIGASGPIRAVKIIESVLPRIFEEFHWDAIDDEMMANDFARTWPDRMLMHISDSVYDGAYAGDGACNHILAHEIGHLMLHRNVDPSFALAKHPPKYDCIFNSEWQADTFADHLLMPTADVRATCVSVAEIANRYYVSEAVAQRRFSAVFNTGIVDARQPRQDAKKKAVKTSSQDQLIFDFRNLEKP